MFKLIIIALRRFSHPVCLPIEKAQVNSHQVLLVFLDYLGSDLFYNLNTWAIPRVQSLGINIVACVSSLVVITNSPAEGVEMRFAKRDPLSSLWWNEDLRLFFWIWLFSLRMGTMSWVSWERALFCWHSVPWVTNIALLTSPLPLKLSLRHCCDETFGKSE